MTGVVLVARVAVVTTLCLAGLTKAFDRRGAIEGAAALGVADRFAPLVGTVLAPTELSLAGLLVLEPTHRWAAGASLAMFVAFTVVLSVNLARGSRPVCHCFGELSGAPVGPMSLVRNVILMVFCGVLATADRPGHAAGSVVLSAALVGAAFLWRRVGSASPKAGQGRAVGTDAPWFDLPSIDGRACTLASLTRTPDHVVLLFADSRCGPCHRLLPEVAGWVHDQLGVAVVMRGEIDAVEATEWGVPVLSDGGRVARAYQVQATPGAVLVARDATIASPVASGPLAIRTLVGGVAHAGGAVDRALVPGVEAPTLALPAVDGGPVVDLRSFIGGLVVVVFARSADELGMLATALADRPADGAPALVVLVRADTDDHGVAAGVSVVWDPDGMTTRAFGVGTTPATVLIDATGRVDSTGHGAAEGVATLVRADALVRLAGRVRTVRPASVEGL